jgi:hypothetical protein
VPDLLYQLILGGALGSVLVPVLARPAERAAADPAEKARMGQITSALLTWTVVIVVPLTLPVPAAGCAILAFGVVAYLLDDGDLKSVLAWVRRVARQRL